MSYNFLIHLHLFGHPNVVSQGVTADLPFTKPTYLLLYLAHRADWVTRAELTLFFRPDTDERTARQGFRTLLTRARKLSWAEGLEQKGNSLRFSPQSDLKAFRNAASEGDWQHVTDLYRGEFLAGVPDLGLATFESWLGVERTTLASIWQGAALKHAAQLTQNEDYLGATTLLAQVLQQDPLAEDVLQALLRSSYLAGEVSAALLTFERFEAQLQEELGLAPLAETRALAASVKRSGSLAPIAPHTHSEVPLSVLRPPIMIGREEEKAALGAEGVRVGIILGEAGVGKSRFMAELAPNALWLRCREGLTQVPYFPLIEAIRGLALSDVLVELGPYRADLARLLPELGDGTAYPVEGDAAKARLLEAIVRVLEAQNAVIVFDDLQWADDATLEVFVLLAHRAHCKLYAAARSNERSEALNKLLGGLRTNAGLMEIELTPLDRAAVQALLTSLSPETGEAQDFSSWLATKSGGNPFFMLETLRALFESNILEASGAAWYSSFENVTQAYRDWAVPPGVAALVARRVEGLSEQAKRVLDVATVLAEGITATNCAQLVGLSAWAASDAVAELEARGLITQARFSHDLTRQALCQGLPESKRTFLHRQVADVSTEMLDDLVRAEHYYQAEALARAAELWLEVAGSRFAAGNFEKEATALYERILTLDLTTETFYRAQAYLAARYQALNRLEEKEVLINSVLQNSRDPLARTVALLQAINSQFAKGKMSQAEQTLQSAEKGLAKVDNQTLRREVALCRIYLDQYSGKIEKALKLAQCVLAEKRADPPDHELINWLSTLAYVQCSAGRFEEALAIYFEQLDVARALKFSRSHVQAVSDIMATLHDLGRVQEGLELGEEALQLGEFDVTFPLRYHLALAYLKQNRLAKVLEQGEAILEGDSSLNIKSHTYALLAEAHAEQQDAAATHQALDSGTALVEAADHNEAKAMMCIAALKFGRERHVERIKPLVEQLEQIKLPAYIQADFDAALALERYP